MTYLINTYFLCLSIAFIDNLEFQVDTLECDDVDDGDECPDNSSSSQDPSDAPATDHAVSTPDKCNLINK